MSQDAPVLAANVDNFDQLVLENSRKGPVLVDFWASWAGPVESLDTALARSPADLDTRFARAAVALTLDDYDAALGHLAEIQRLDAAYRNGLVRQALLVVLVVLVVLDMLGPDDARTQRFRQSLFQH